MEGGRDGRMEGSKEEEEGRERAGGRVGPPLAGDCRITTF